MALPLTPKGVSIAIVLSTLALSALFLARGTTSLVAGALFPLEAAPAGGGKGGAAQKAPGTDPPDIHAILKRNAFDPTTGSLWPPKPAEVAVDPNAGTEPEEPEQPVDGKLPPACDQSVKLVAAVYSERNPEWSFASLGSGSTPPLLYREGSKVADREVVSIYPSAVYMRMSNGRLCSLTMFVDPNQKAASNSSTPASEPAVPATPPPMTSSSGGTSEAELDAAITKVSDTQYTVKRSFVDKLLGDQAELMRAARIVPHEENGQVVGVKLYGIRRNSLLGKLGIQNGDLLRNINDMSMGSPDSALEAYSKLRSASDLKVAITRRGQDMSLGFGITE